MQRALQARLVAGAIGMLIGAATLWAEPRREPNEQLVVVVTETWTSTVGELRRFARDDRSWRAVGAPVRVSLGKSGLGWAPDVAAARAGEPAKREGDGRSPAGAFALGLLTGYDAAPPAGTRLPYRQATAALRCVDDPRAPEYNREVDVPDGGAPWSSDEHMLRDDGQYRLTIYIAYNPSREAKLGSCIFLHVWRAPDSPTVGCTAMTLENLRELVAWLDPGRHPLLVQVPRAAYRRLQRELDLPELDGKRK